MPPRRPSRPTSPDVDALRAALGQGKIVRVGIAPSGQFPDGVTGRVRRIGDPAIDGDEFLFVEVPVGGTKDVLPFATKDLTSAPARRSAGHTSSPLRQATVGLSPGTGQLRPATGGRPATPVRPAASVSTARLLPSTATATTATPPLVAAGATNPSVDNADTASPPPTTTPTAKRTGQATARSTPLGGRGKRAPVTITISTVGDEAAAWRIDARIGARAAVRSTVIPPSRVWEIVQSLGEPKLTEVVQTLLEDHRRSTQARADALAAELSDLQAELNSFPTN
jgi:hypothetical protein